MSPVLSLSRAKNPTMPKGTAGRSLRRLRTALAMVADAEAHPARFVGTVVGGAEAEGNTTMPSGMVSEVLSLRWTVRLCCLFAYAAW